MVPALGKLTWRNAAVQRTVARTPFVFRIIFCAEQDNLLPTQSSIVSLLQFSDLLSSMRMAHAALFVMMSPAL